MLDVYRPKSVEGALPVIVDIHGGGWYYGDKELNKYYCMSLVKYGFAVVNVSYRLAPGAFDLGSDKRLLCRYKLRVGKRRKVRA